MGWRSFPMTPMCLTIATKQEALRRGSETLYVLKTGAKSLKIVQGHNEITPMNMECVTYRY